MKINWKGVLRDVIIIWAITWIGGFVVGIAGGGAEWRRQSALVASNILFSVVGFTISGCIVKVDRFKHLFVVAIVLWVTNIINIPLGYLSFASWFPSIFLFIILMAIGGAMSFIFVRAPRSVSVNEKPINQTTKIIQRPQINKIEIANKPVSHNQQDKTAKFGHPDNAKDKKQFPYKAELQRNVFEQLLKEKKDEATILQARIQCGDDKDKVRLTYYKLRYNQIVESGEIDKFKEKILAEKKELDVDHKPASLLPGY